jgi:S-DNA-T family DNA segregation ATPase FtsK/SpoIIIE
VRAGLTAIVGGQADDVWGVGFLVLAGLAALGIYGNLTGPAGRALTSGAGDLVGWGRVLVPLALGLVGWVLIGGRPHSRERGRSPADPEGISSARRNPEATGGARRYPEASGRAPARVGLACALAIVAASGLLQLFAGPQRWPGSVASLRDAGGVIGAGVAIPLRDGLASWGAGLVLVSLLGLSLLVLTATPVRSVTERATKMVAGAAGALVRGARWATGVAHRRGRREAADRHPASVVAELAGHSSLGAPGGRRAAGEEPYGAGVEPYVADLATSGPGDAATGSAADTGAGVGAATGAGVGAATGAGVGTVTGVGVGVAGAAGSGKAAVRPVPPVHLPVPDEPRDPDQLPLEIGRVAGPGTWRLPPVALLTRGKAAEVDRRLIEAMGRTLEDALAAHGVETRLVGMTVGPTVTRYELELGPGVKVAKVTSLQKDIAYAMAAADVRILAPIPGRSAIGVEVPNHHRQIVTLGDILASGEAAAAVHPLEVAVGRDIAGRPVLENLATMPHLLIAGATGAGKSSCINSIIASVLVRATPDQVRLILVDPKRVELGQYNGLPHLLTQVVVNPKRAANALSWAVHEMERRYDLLAEVGVRDITGYNAAFDRGELTAALDGDRERQRLPFILIVVDELNDLMMVAARDVEESICRIAQMARAVGIHLVIATQRPSVDVITGVIKANVPSRLAFAVSSLADSRVILDQPGAERLIGKGDMLLLTASSSVARRIQGAWVDEDEVRKVVAHWRRQSEPDYVPGVEGEGSTPGASSGEEGDDDDLAAQAMELVVRSQLGSTSMLQRKLRVGFARAGRLMDLLEQRGVVGPSEGSKARAVLMTVDELDERRTENK